MGNFNNNVSVTFVVEQYLQSFSHVCAMCIHVPCHKGQVFNDRFNLKASKFPGGTCPQTSLRSNCALRVHYEYCAYGLEFGFLRACHQPTSLLITLHSIYIYSGYACIVCEHSHVLIIIYVFKCFQQTVIIVLLCNYLTSSLYTGPPPKSPSQR